MQSSGSRSTRRWLFALLVLLIIAIAGGWYWHHRDTGTPQTGQDPASTAQGRRAGNGSNPTRPGFGALEGPTPVRVARVTLGDFPLYYKALGTVTALNTVNVRTRVAGELVKVAFREGQTVKAGELLAQIDPRSYRIALQQAEGTLAQNQALLKNAQLDYKRYQDLFAQDSIARQTLDTQQSLVAQYEGTIKTNQAAVNDAKLNLDYTDIRSPIAGRVGLRQLDMGNLLAANDSTAVAVVTQIKPISVTFTLPETQLDPVLERYRNGARLAVEAWDRGDTKLQASGVLQSPDNQIDTTTGTLRFKAAFENTTEALFPNQFVNVRMLVDTLKQVVLAPTAAIQYGTDGSFVYVLDGADTVRVRQLKLGASDGSSTVIEAGLAQGDQVVLEGTDRLRDGSQVQVVSDPEQVVPTTPGEHLQGQSAPSATGKRAGKPGA